MTKQKQTFGISVAAYLNKTHRSLIIHTGTLIALDLTLFHIPSKPQLKGTGRCYLYSIALQSGNVWMALEQKA